MPNLSNLEREAVILGYKNGGAVGPATARTGGMPDVELVRRLDNRGVLSESHRHVLREIYKQSK